MLSSKLFHQGLALALALSVVALLDNSANAQGRGGSGGRGGVGGGAGGSMGARTSGGFSGGTGGARISGGAQEGFRGQGGANYGMNRGDWDRGGGNWYGGRSGDWDRGGNWYGGRGDWDRGGNWYGRGGDWNRWDGDRYYSYYGRGWGYYPDYGWGINIPLGRYGYLGLGNYGYGYGGYPYYGNWNYWGPDYYGYYGSGPYDYYYQPSYYSSYEPAYDTYAYDNSAQQYTSQYPSQSDQYAQGGEQNQGQLPPLPTADQLSKFTERQLQSFIAWVANGYTRELGQFDTGNTWVNYFRLNDLKSLAPMPPRMAQAQPQAGQAPNLESEQSKNVINDVLRKMDSTAGNEQFKSIADTWGFKALQLALREAEKSPKDRDPVVLKGQADMLSKALSNVSTGDGWRKFLDIDTINRIADQRNIQANDETKRITQKFDEVVRNPEYQSITQLPGFGGVYSVLHKIEGSQEPAATATRVPSPPEATR